MQPELERFFTTHEIAKRLRVCDDWARKAFRHYPGVVKLDGGHLRIPESVLDEFLRKRGYTPQPQSENGEKADARSGADREVVAGNPTSA